MADVKLIHGEIFRDPRGKIASLNHFGFEKVKRVYFITHPDISVIRGWHGHKLESKWFYCVKGKFTLGLVEIDNWENPSKTLKPQIFHLSEERSEIIYMPSGYASCIIADEPDSILMVLSNMKYDESTVVSDSFRYDKNYWFDWSDIK